LLDIAVWHTFLETNTTLDVSTGERSFIPIV
jgi:hypothetical protein